MTSSPQQPHFQRLRREPLTLFLLAAVPLWLLLALLGTQTFSFREDLWYSMANTPGQALRVVVLMVPGTVAAFLLWVGWVAGRRSSRR